MGSRRLGGLQLPLQGSRERRQGALSSSSRERRQGALSSSSRERRQGPVSSSSRRLRSAAFWISFSQVGSRM
jgi:hypothetical protein